MSQRVDRVRELKRRALEALVAGDRAGGEEEEEKEGGCNEVTDFEEDGGVGRLVEEDDRAVELRLELGKAEDAALRRHTRFYRFLKECLGVGCEELDGVLSCLVVVVVGGGGGGGGGGVSHCSSRHASAISHQP
ncbi:hypothetical protein HDU67_000615 [Dinochytrium kinnereticum]|nr:hypothetical protein HDU67_000615 [Dinochytrium kinnereticum]